VSLPDPPRRTEHDAQPGRSPGYDEHQPRSPADARQPAIPAQPTPDEAGIGHDPDAQPDPADKPAGS
jgi:hypothetical protein